MTIINAGLNHHTSPIELREKFAIEETQIAKTLSELQQYTGYDELAIISTCNRCEFFSFSKENKYDTIFEWACKYFHIEPEILKKHWIKKKDIHAVEHLMKIACGLDSVIIGEPQILGQIKTAYQIAKQNKYTQIVFNRLFEHSISTAKQIRSDTDLGCHSISYASIVLDILNNLFEDLSTKEVLIIGVSEMTQLVIKHFKKNNINLITIANRTYDKASKLARQFDINTEDFQRIEDILYRYDIIISCTSSQSLILNKQAIQDAIKKRNRQPMYIADLAVPRDIDPNANAINEVYLYSLDNLAKMIDKNQKLRMSAGNQAENIIAQRSQEFMYWLESRDTVPLITEYREQTKIQCENILQQALQQLRDGQDNEKVLRELAHTLSNKLMHPMTKLISNTNQNEDLVQIIHNILNDIKRQ